MNRKQKRVVIAGLSLVFLIGLSTAIFNAHHRSLTVDEQVVNWLLGGAAIVTVIGLLVFSDDK